MVDSSVLDTPVFPVVDPPVLDPPVLDPPVLDPPVLLLPSSRGFPLPSPVVRGLLLLVCPPGDQLNG
jgi:hypothetical protein